MPLPRDRPAGGDGHLPDRDLPRPAAGLEPVVDVGEREPEIADGPPIGRRRGEPVSVLGFARGVRRADDRGALVATDVSWRLVVGRSGSYRGQGRGGGGECGCACQEVPALDVGYGGAPCNGTASQCAARINSWALASIRRLYPQVADLPGGGASRFPGRSPVSRAGRVSSGARHGSTAVYSASKSAWQVISCFRGRSVPSLRGRCSAPW
jgi:hypothetical protein